MIRRSFLKRMALAAAACAFIDVPWPKPITQHFVGVRFTHHGQPMVFPLPAEWAHDYQPGDRVPITGADGSHGTFFSAGAV